MEKIIKWISTHKILAIFIVLFVFLLPLVVIHCLFKCRSGVSWLEAEWQAGDVLNYIAGFEALLGTVVLGAVTVFDICLYLTNRSISGIDYKEKIYIEKSVGLKESIMYKAYEEETGNA